MKYLFLLLIVFLGSCSVQKRIGRIYKHHPELVPKESVKIKDSIVYKHDIVRYDSIVTIPGHDVRDTIPIPCPDVSVAGSKNSGNVTLSYYTKGGKLYVDCKADSLQRIIHNLKETISEFNSHKSDTVKVITVKFIPKFYRFTFWFFWMLCGSVILYLNFKINKHRG